MLRVGLIKHHCPFRAVAAAVSGTHIIAHLQFLPFLSERSSVGRFWEVGIVLSLSTRLSRLFCGEREALGTPISAVSSAPIIRTQPTLEFPLHDKSTADC